MQINRSLIIKAENDLLKQIEVKKVELLMLQEEINCKCAKLCFWRYSKNLFCMLSCQNIRAGVTETF